MTSYEAIRKDLENAGARWIDQEVVSDDREPLPVRSDVRIPKSRPSGAAGGAT